MSITKEVSIGSATNYLVCERDPNFLIGWKLLGI